MRRVVLERDGRRFDGDLSNPLSLAMPLDFDGAQPNHFGAPRAGAQPLTDREWVGDVSRGGTVNCAQIVFVPHCNGTHTECVGHLTIDRISIHDVLRGGLQLARLITVRPTRRAETSDSVDTAATPDEWVVTADAIDTALAALPGNGEALVIRTLPNDETKLGRAYAGAAPAPYFTGTAIERLVALGVEHLVVDVPSLDRAHDGGRMIAHRAFWGLPAGARRLAEASRPHATITELAFVASTIPDGWYVLDLQLPAFLSDAAPSRPLLYPLTAS